MFWPEIPVPTVVVHGSDDDQCPVAHGQAIAAAIPGAELEIWEGRGHNLMAEDARRFAATIEVLATEACRYKYVCCESVIFQWYGWAQSIPSFRIRSGDCMPTLRTKSQEREKVTVSTSGERKGAVARGREDLGGEETSLTERAYRQLEELIATLQLPPGTVLSELMLAQRLKIGRTPIREALQRLARDGLVVVLPRRGVLVSEINLRTQLRLLEVRRVLERLMAELAAERASDDECQGFADIAAGHAAGRRSAPTTSSSCGSTGR